jgi:hypothetical protein
LEKYFKALNSALQKLKIMTTKAYLNPNQPLQNRYEKTLSFLKRINLEANNPILDIGSENPFTSVLRDKGFTVYNTGKTDLDLHPDFVTNFDVNIVVAFEILEHLVSPFPLLQSLPGQKLIATVPLRLWFKSAYKNPNDPWDRHYHEFEDWQFDWLLEKSGWKVLYKEKWTSPIKKIGIRPVLRYFTPRYYAIYAERIQD